MPATRTRFSPASRATSSVARTASSPPPTGVHTAPRAKTGTPLTAKASTSRSASKPGPGASARNPTRPAATASAPSRISRTSCRTGSPCVCGHQRSAPGTRTSAANAPSSPTAACAAQPATSTATARTPPAARPRTASTPSSPSTRGRSAISPTDGPRRRTSHTGRHGPTIGGPGAQPRPPPRGGAAPAQRPPRPPGPHGRGAGGEARRAPGAGGAHEARPPAVVDHLGPPALARTPRDLGQDVVQRRAVDHELVGPVEQQGAHVGLVAQEHRAPLQHLDAVEQDREHGGDAVDGQHDLLARRRRRAVEGEVERALEAVGRRAALGGREAVQAGDLVGVVLRPARHPGRRARAPTPAPSRPAPAPGRTRGAARA